MGGKNVVIGGLLLAIIVIAAVFAVRRVSSKPAMPDWLLDKQVEKIDIKSLEVVSALYGDWQGKYAPDSSGRCKSPKNGEYTMVDVIKCNACGQLIPNVQIPPEVQGNYKDKSAMVAATIKDIWINGKRSTRARGAGRIRSRTIFWVVRDPAGS